MQDEPHKVVIGEITGVFGVKGSLKVRSYTDPVENILDYAPWRMRLRNKTRHYRVLEGRLHGTGLVVGLDGVTDRDVAQELVGWEIVVDREQLPEIESDEYYWADLIGSQVVTTEGEHLGNVVNLMETGSNDVLIVVGERERLIPFIIDQVVREVDKEAMRIVVDWDPDF